MEAIKEMMHGQDLPMNLWAQEARIVVYVQNHIPHRVLDNKTPKEAFSEEKPEANHLRIFGCPMYITYPKGEKDQV